MHEILFGSQRFLARADRTLYHPASGALFLSDLHLGKGHLFRSEGIPIPKGSESQDLKRLIHAVRTTNAKSLWILGDLFHHPKSINSNLIYEWTQTLMGLQVERNVILGNHDRSAEQYAFDLGFVRQPEPTLWQDLELAHHPNEVGIVPRIAGHVHPQAEFKTATDHIVCPCFAMPNNLQLLLPAFTTFSGGPRYSVQKTRVFPVIGGYVLDSAQMTQNLLQELQ